MSLAFYTTKMMTLYDADQSYLVDLNGQNITASARHILWGSCSA